MRLGDRLEQALALAGVTPARVEAWLGRPCGCAARKEKLNALGFWARRVLSGRVTMAREHLEGILGGETGDSATGGPGAGGVDGADAAGGRL